MAKWKITTVEKKSIADYWLFVKEGDKWAKVEEWWRWGYAVVESKTKPKLGRSNQINIYNFDEVLDQETDDGVATWFDYADSVTEEERADFENAYWEGLEEVNNLGWIEEDNERIFVGPIKVEKYEE